MSAERFAAMAETYRNCAQLFGTAGDLIPMLAHQEVASLMDQVSLAIREAEQSAHDPKRAGAVWPVPPLTSFYQPRARRVAVWCGGQLVEFTEQEAEALSASLFDALAIRDAARAFDLEVTGEAA